jgi:hypothetical protein
VGAASSVDGWWLLAERAVPAAMVVVLLPVGDHDAGLGQGPEDVDVEAFRRGPLSCRMAVGSSVSGCDGGDVPGIPVDEAVVVA